MRLPRPHAVENSQRPGNKARLDSEWCEILLKARLSLQPRLGVEVDEDKHSHNETCASYLQFFHPHEHSPQDSTKQHSGK